MKLADLGKAFGVHTTKRTQELESFLDSSLREGDYFDFDVFLPTVGRNLQRGLVWTLEQKRSFITNLFQEIPVLPVTLYQDCTVGDGGYNKAIKVIDGKQRITTVRGFVNNEFSLVLEEGEFLFSELPKALQTRFLRRIDLQVYVYTATQERECLSDEYLVYWFNMINAGTPQ